MRYRQALVWAYVLAVTGWAVWLAWMPARLDAAPVDRAVGLAAGLTYQAGALVCHQQPDRSFHEGRWPWPVCARCAGLYAGSALGACACALLWGLHRRRPWALQARRVQIALVVAALPTALTWLAERVGVAPIGLAGRWLAAVPLGAAVSAFIVAAIGGSTVTDSDPATGVH